MRSVSEPYDFAFAGGGAAGLTLAMTLVNSPLREGSIAIIDPALKTRNDRTFAFWAEGESPYEPLLRRSWSKLRFASTSFEQVYDLAPYRYCMLPALAFYRHANSLLRSHPRVDFINGHVKGIDNHADQARLWVAGQPVAARWVFDSRFSMKSYLRDSARAPHKAGKVRLCQRFHGWFIETPTAAFEADTATLFDFRVPQHGDVRFCYLLPFDERRALVEVVSLQRLAPEPILDHYLRRVLKIGDYRVVTIENGASPLTDGPFPRQLGSRTLAIGILGGQLKPSSGYAFTRMHCDAENIVASLLKAGHPFHLPETHPLFHLCDVLLLEVMQRHPERMEAIYTAMFHGSSPQGIFRFLDERASLPDILHMMLSLPSGVFLEALLKRAWSGGLPGGAFLRRLAELSSSFRLPSR